MSKVIRSVKNVTKGYSAVQVKVRNATSNDPWGPTGTEMSEIAQMTFNSSNDFYEIMDMLDKRLNDKGKNWRHVLKALKVLDYCLHEGSELVVTWARKNVYIIKTLGQFQYVDEDGKDVGQNVRVSAKELTSLILDEDRLRTERQDRKIWKSRVTGIEEFGPPTGFGDNDPPPRQRPDRRGRRNGNGDDEDTEYRLAIEASKREAEEERKRRDRNASVPNDDDLAKAIKLSKEEEELRKRELEESNASALFDDTPAPNTQPQPTGYNHGYQQQGAVDWDGNTIDQQQQQQQLQQQQQQQPMATGYLNNAYSNPTGGFMAQPTGYQGMNGYPNNGYTGTQSIFDQQQQFPMQPQQESLIQQQPTAFNSSNNPYAQAGMNFTGQQSSPMQTGFAPAGSNNPWAIPQGPTSQLDALKPLPTGSNNPFASSLSRPQPQPTNTAPTLSTLAEQKVQTQFNNHNFNPATSFTSPPIREQKEQNPQHARLNALLATGEGMDTFGNTGELRIPAQHTAPGTFVNSAGQNLSKLNQTRTGSNPFYQQQQQPQQMQFTGVPQSTGFGGAASPFGPSGGQLAPAQTGPAHLNGYGNPAFGGGVSSGAGGASNNPFGGQGHGQQPHHPQQSGSLIDL
ncbi:MAG: hypothetical protein M1823_002846 [Watsoniomyces obsoletus]|nr:MAG: hypothetical protein M1823_002846 [Watsoniomyces obsoletus]